MEPHIDTYLDIGYSQFGNKANIYIQRNVVIW